MNNAKVQNRVRKLHIVVKAMQATGDIPANSAKEVFLLLLEKSLAGESINRAFD